MSLLLLTLSLPAHAEALGGKWLSFPTFTSFVDDVLAYQIGSTWGKVPVSRTEVMGEVTPFSRAAKVTARYALVDGEGGVRGATGFYLGKYNGRHLLGTNHHVAAGIPCESAQIDFLYQGERGTRVHCDHVIGTWTDIDFGLVILSDVPEEIESTLAINAIQLELEEPVRWHQELMTMGFGIAMNHEPSQAHMMVNRDEDCRVYSADGESRYIADPDTINPGDYSVYSYAVGCEVSHGDSGSAILDRATGKMNGIIWTVATPKFETTRDSRHLASLSATDPEVWSQLDYAVPAIKIRDYLMHEIEEEEAYARAHPNESVSNTPTPGHFTPEDRQIVRDWLESQ